MRRQKITLFQSIKTNDDCYKFLTKIKWPDESFVCRKCGSTKFYKGRSPYSRRCSQCKYDESVTVGTMFDKLKFPILIAFSMVNDLISYDQGNSSFDLSEKYGLNRNTCLSFKYKIQRAIGALRQKRLGTAVGVGVYNIYNEMSESYFYRRVKPKQRIVFAIEIIGAKVNRAFGCVINDGKAQYVRDFINRYIDKDAYIAMKEMGRVRIPHKEFPYFHYVDRHNMLDAHFNLFKKWLQDERRHIDYNHLQGYLDEYIFRFNRHKNKKRDFSSIIRAMVVNKK